MGVHLYIFPKLPFQNQEVLLLQIPQHQDILSHLKSDGVEVYGKGTHGRHNDNTATVMAWFKSQYQKLLEEDFHRKK